ncbi:A disintegrin and metalloproteinase with thrombospondin motifs adt-2-like [Mercenaria mercenaria]|uniref:A disintegrin and metalloproteinase with thrombospondin motifs adt-2-like n=1 Tax=Mercenaria mercenaria TaxID=6596 RepID=UPI00234E37E4|nr:A disintegrin and metalloproteinase with thrombospondin motifs adt-2-like [Mercenaria mercenaria]
MKTCPCMKGGTIDSAQNSGQWEDWSSWQCQRSADSCYVFRTRHCSVPDTKNCPTKGSSQLKLWEGTCPCGNVSESISTSSPPSTTTTTTVSTVATVSSTLLTTQSQPLIQTTYASHWLEWGEWDCHSVGFGCMQTRWRNCSAEDHTKCNGNRYELNSCTQNTCKDSSPDATTASPLAKWTPWGPWECHNEQIPCVLYRYRNCSTFEIDCEAKGGSNYELMTCGDMCAVPDKASTTDTSTVDISTPVTTSSNTTPFSVTYWLEWGSWDCKKQETGLCLMARTRNCSTYNPDDCEIKVTGAHYELRPCDTDICAAQSSAQWSDWFYGKCSVSCGNGTTNRLRHCSTGHDEDCAGSPFETVPCAATDCSVLEI